MNIKEIRKLSGLNVRQFIEKYGIPYTTFHDWDTGKSNPPVYVLELLERVARIDFDKDRINLLFAKGLKEKIQAAADAAGLSKTQYAEMAILEKIERDKSN